MSESRSKSAPVILRPYHEEDDNKNYNNTSDNTTEERNDKGDVTRVRRTDEKEREKQKEREGEGEEGEDQFQLAVMGFHTACVEKKFEAGMDYIIKMDFLLHQYGLSTANTKGELDDRTVLLSLVRSEMLTACEMKLGNLSLNELRNTTIYGSSLLSSPSLSPLSSPSHPSSPEYIAMLCKVCLQLRIESNTASASENFAKQAVNLYRGYLRRELKSFVDAAMKKLLSAKSLRKLDFLFSNARNNNNNSHNHNPNSSSNNSNNTDKYNSGEEPDAPAAHSQQPPLQESNIHVSTLASILGEISKRIVWLLECFGGVRNVDPGLLGEGEGDGVKVIMREFAYPLVEDGAKYAESLISSYIVDAELKAWQEKCLCAQRNSSTSISANNNNISMNNKSFSSPSLNVQALDFVLDELAFTIHLNHRFIDFVEDNLNPNNSIAKMNPCSGSSSNVKALTQPLFINIQQLVGFYVTMEDSYCVSNIKKCIEIAEPVEVQESVYVSSMVEDGIFLLRKSLERAYSTLSEQSVMAICNRVTEILQPDAIPSFYISLVNVKVPVHFKNIYSGSNNLNINVNNINIKSGGIILEGGSSMIDGGAGANLDEESDFSSALLRAMDEEDGFESDPSSLIYSTNSLDVALQALEGLRNTLIVFGEEGRMAKAVMESMASEMTKGLQIYKDAISSRIKEYVSVYAIRKVIPRLDFVFSKTDAYHIDSNRYEHLLSTAGSTEHIVTPFTSEFVGRMFDKDKILVQCKSSMTDGSLILLMKTLTETLSEAISNRLCRRMRFTECGALVLRKEIRFLQSKFSEVLEGRGTLISEFSRLNQVVLLLNLEKPSDLHHYKGFVDQFNEDEIKELLLQRVEFNADNIMRIKI